MSKLKGFKKFGLVLSAGLAVGACSPMAPSVSKLSNAAGDKTTPTDGSSPSLNVTGASASSAGFSAGGKSTLASGSAAQITQVQPYSNFQSQWGIISDVKPSADFSSQTQAMTDLKTNGAAIFKSPDSIKGKEDSLSATKAAIFLVVNADPATISSQGLAGLKANIRWVAASSDSAAHWELIVATPNTGDPVKDMDELKAQLSALQDHLVDVAVEFEVD